MHNSLSYKLLYLITNYLLLTISFLKVFYSYFEISGIDSYLENSLDLEVNILWKVIPDRIRLILIIDVSAIVPIAKLLLDV